MAKRPNFLVFGKPNIGPEEIAEVVATLASGWIGTGPKVEKFESMFKKYANSRYALAVNSATAGLHLALKAVGIEQGDEVITTPLTFCSTANVIIHCGGTPVFADVDKDTWNIDPDEITKKITPRTKAIMKIARKHNLFVIEDAAHAIETVYHGKKVGSIADITVFSFYATKNITTAEGGMVTTNNKKWADMIKVMRLHGLSHDAYKRYSVKTFKHYQAMLPGYKYNMTDLQAAMGIQQLKKISSFAKTRKKHWLRYNDAFKDMPELILPAKDEEDTTHARHLYAILTVPEKLDIDRDRFVEELIGLNIGTGIHFFPVHLHPYYQTAFGYKRGDFPNAEFIGDRILSLPLGANLTKTDINDVIEAVRFIVNRHRK